jgi:predicted nucleotidyltransferase
MLALVEQHREQIEQLCRKYHVVRLELFGSAARGDFNPETSDLDFFVEYEDLGWEGSSKRYFGLLHGLEDLLQRRIDLVDRSAVTNPYFLKVANRYIETVYGAPVAKAS